MNIKDINSDMIQYLKQNKHEITEELLELLRSYGNEGKQIAIDILDIEKDEEQYYLDAFGNRISFDGDRGLKKPLTKIKLSEIHLDEIRKCKEDIHYFKDNYVKIKTKSGINFPDMRDYQNEFIDVMQSEAESIVSLQGRQCCSASTPIKIINKSEEYEISFEDLFNECKRENT